MPRGGEHNLSEAIRRALEVFGPDSDREKTQKIKQWIKQQYPSLSKKVEDKNFGPALSTMGGPLGLAAGGAVFLMAIGNPSAPAALAVLGVIGGGTAGAICGPLCGLVALARDRADATDGGRPVPGPPLVLQVGVAVAVLLLGIAALVVLTGRP
jgi:hypothetical protein